MAWLLTWMVQSLALVLATVTIVRLPGFRSSAAARSAAWSVVLCAIVVLGAEPWWPAAAAPVAAGTPEWAETSAAPTLVVPAVPVPWVVALFGLWAAGTLVWLGYAWVEVRRVWALKQDCEPLSEDELARVPEWSACLATGRAARLCWCDTLDGPAVLGFGDPVVALPRLHGACLSDQDLSQVLLHELAHVRRGDDWASLVELVVAALVWVNPATHLARRGIGLAREMACDEWVIRRTGAPAAYARCLAEVAGLRRTQGRARLATAATRSPSALRRRVVRILAPGLRRPSQAAALLALLTPLAVGLLALLLIQTPPLAVEDLQVPTGDPMVVAPRIPAWGQPAVEHQAGAPGLMVAAPPVPAQTPTGSGRSSPSAAAALQTGQATPAAAEDARLLLPAEVRSESDVLPAAPLPAAFIAGAITADTPTVPGTTATPARAPWWAPAVSLGAATGDGATAVGRATGSFFKRVGASVSHALTR
jgi:beta-lactamase regulating signal transducer with metallopeptidase domain